VVVVMETLVWVNVSCLNVSNHNEGTHVGSTCYSEMHENARGGRQHSLSKRRCSCHLISREDFSRSQPDEPPYTELVSQSPPACS